MNFIEICNNSLYAGLRALQDSPKDQYSIYYNGIIYTKYSVYNTENKIYMSNNLGDIRYMDLNDFVKYVQDKAIKIEVIEKESDI